MSRQPTTTRQLNHQPAKLTAQRHALDWGYTIDALGEGRTTP